MKKAMKKKGFTLVEIMIVVAIIGLLAAIGIPSFQKARSRTMAKTAVNNARLVNAAVDQIAMDTGLTDGSPVTAAEYVEYIKGKADGLMVGAVSATAAGATVGTELTEADLYPGASFLSDI
ncbi:prepilin-type N-terminal cleavage/methylation domain-containing protein [Pontiellaceae bacterium B1224]|nr:prepilin-type N-terminal cleavage/methylation domain-containing protein [Pontiellaceae bacterium B1224]